MLASQMIYTACGKDRSGSFSVWSKSSDVTQTECDDIIKLMSYLKPKGVPYEPNEEELRTLFPVKYGYFILSSGRRCVASSAYVGKVYSDMDTRNGNFVIHAYIFNDLEGFNPFGLMNMNVFRRKLSYSEWHDNPAPDELPKVELESNFSIDESVLRSMLTGANRNIYASLLQSVLDSVGTDATVTFNDSEANLKHIYSFIGAFLPAKLFNDVTFMNQYSTQLNYMVSSMGALPVKIRNIFSGLIDSVYRYEEEIEKGHYAFNFSKGIGSPVISKRYVVDIIGSFETERLFPTLKKVSAVNKIMEEANCDVDSAVAVYHVSQKHFNWFKDAVELTKAMDIAISKGYVDQKSAALDFYKSIVLTGKWGKGKEIIDLIRFAYENNDALVKKQIIYDFFNNFAAYGVNISEGSVSVVNQIKANAPFPWNDFVRLIINDPTWESYISKKSSISELYFVFDGLVCAIGQSANDAVNNKAYDMLLRIFKKSVDSCSLELVKLCLDDVKKLGSKVENFLLENGLDGVYNSRIENVDLLEFVIKVILLANDENKKVGMLATIVLSNIQTSHLLPVYIKFETQNPNVFAGVERELARDPEFSRFQNKKEAHVFKNTARVTFNDLTTYFNKFYKTGYDSGIYLEKVKQYIASLDSKSRVAQCVKLYNQIKYLGDDFNDVVEVLAGINNGLFSLTMEELINFTPMYMLDIDQLNNRLINAGITVPDKYKLLKTVNLVRAKSGKQKLILALKNNCLYGDMNGPLIAKYVSRYFPEVLEAYMDVKKLKELKRNQILVAVFEKPLADPQNNAKIIEHIGNSGWRYDIMADIMAHAFNVNDRLASTFINFVDSYVDKMKYGENKKMFKKALKILPEEDRSAVQKYADEYLKEHMSFFAKLFSKNK